MQFELTNCQALQLDDVEHLVAQALQSMVVVDVSPV